MICPFCKEEIKDGAIKCKHCGSMLEEKISPIVNSPSASANEIFIEKTLKPYTNSNRTSTNEKIGFALLIIPLISTIGVWGSFYWVQSKILTGVLLISYYLGFFISAFIANKEACYLGFKREKGKLLQIGGPGAVFVGIFLLWPIVLPCYMYSRGKKGKKNLFIPSIVIVLIVLFTFGWFGWIENNLNSNYIQIVKKGNFEKWPDNQIGESFDRFFGSPSWRYFKSDNSEDIVEFTGNFLFDNKKAEAKIQFKVKKDTFEVGYIGVDEDEKNILFFSMLMNKVFNNKEIEEANNETETGSNEADTKDKFKITMGDMKSIGTAIESYVVDWSFAPQVENLEDLNAPFFVPFYIKTLPLKDAWENDFIYAHSQDSYSIASSGSDGRFEGFNQTGTYFDWEHKDIIYSNGIFTYLPHVER